MGEGAQFGVQRCGNGHQELVGMENKETFPASRVFNLQQSFE